MRKLFILSFFGVSLFLLTSCDKKEEVVTISTRVGEIVLVLYDETPLHKANFLKLAKEGFYDSTTFHRVMDGFMIQGGDPNSMDDDPFNDGAGGPGYRIKSEFNSLFTHKYGALSAARQPDTVNPMKESSGSQFFIVEPVEGAHFLDNEYTVYGETIAGFDVIEKIAEQPKDARNRPYDNIYMIVTVESMSRKKIAEKYNYEFDVIEKVAEQAKDARNRPSNNI